MPIKRTSISPHNFAAYCAYYYYYYYYYYIIIIISHTLHSDPGAAYVSKVSQALSNEHRVCRFRASGEAVRLRS